MNVVEKIIGVSSTKGKLKEKLKSSDTSLKSYFVKLNRQKKKRKNIYIYVYIVMSMLKKFHDPLLRVL